MGGINEKPESILLPTWFILPDDYSAVGTGADGTGIMDENLNQIVEENVEIGYRATGPRSHVMLQVEMGSTYCM